MDAQITVQYERKFSDGNYGSEGLSLTWTGPCGDGETLVIAARYTQIAGALRASVLGELAKSSALQVARAAKRELQPPQPQHASTMSDEAYFDAMADAQSY
jgi:hypothetical protein